MITSRWPGLNRLIPNVSFRILASGIDSTPPLLPDVLRFFAERSESGGFVFEEDGTV
jgi:hypothetical protein